MNRVHPMTFRLLTGSLLLWSVFAGELKAQPPPAQTSTKAAEQKKAEENPFAPEVLGQPIDLLLPQRFAHIHHQHLIEFAGSADTARRMGERRDIYGRRKDGTEFPAEASISRWLPSGPRGVIERALDRLGAGPVHSFESLYEADHRAREAAAELVGAEA